MHCYGKLEPKGTSRVHALADRVMRAAGVWMGLARRQVGLKVPGLGLEI